MPTTDEIKKQLKQDVALAESGDKKTIRSLLENPRMQAEIAKALPTAMTAERFTRLVLTAVRANPMLLEAEAESLLAACMTCAQLGLEPATPLGHCWLLPFRDRKSGKVNVTFILGYKGIVLLAHRSDYIESLEARTVFENDEFEFEYGIDEKLRHRPVLNNPGEPVAYYALARFKGGGRYWVVISPETVAEHRARSASPNSPAWSDPSSFDAMARKTAIRVAAPYLPLSALAAQALAADDTTPQWAEYTTGVAEQAIDVPSSEQEAPSASAPDALVNVCEVCGAPDGNHEDGCERSPF